MNILEYVKSLAPIMERRELLSALDQVQLEYTDTLLPMLSDVQEVFAGIQLKSNFYKKFDTQLRRSANIKDSAFTTAIASMLNLGAVIEITRKEIRSNFSIQFTNVGLSYSRANVIKFVDALAFYVKYSRKWLLTIIAQESAMLGKATREVWSPAELDYITTGMDQFVLLLPTMSLKADQIAAAINKASEASIEEETFAVANQTLGMAKTDPLAIDGFITIRSPFMMLTKHMAELKHNRYLLAKEEVYGMQQRLEELRMLKQGDPTNPVHQKLIQEYEKRVSEYEYRIAKIEEKAGL